MCMTCGVFFRRFERGQSVETQRGVDFHGKNFFFVCMSDVFFRRFECWGKHVENCMTLACMHVARESTFFGEKIKHVPQGVMHVEFPDMHKNPPAPQGTRRKLSMSAEFAAFLFADCRILFFADL